MSELGICDLETHSSDGNHGSWGARCVDKLPLQRCSILVFVIGPSRMREVPTGSFRFCEGLQLALRCTLNRSWILRKDWEMGFVPLPLHWAQGEGWWGGAWEGGRGKLVQVLTHHQVQFLCLLYYCMTLECNPCWLSELSDLGIHPSSGSPRSWGTHYVVQPCTPQGGAGHWRFPANCMALCKG